MSDTPLSDPISLRLAPPLQAGVAACAAAMNLSPAEAVEHLVRSALLAHGGFLNADQRRQVAAEMRLMGAVDAIAARMKAADDWGDDATLRVFEEIRERHGEDHREAVAGGGAARIHREIGKRVRKGLDAEVVMNGAAREMGQLPRSSPALIRSYTVLRRRGRRA